MSFNDKFDKLIESCEDLDDIALIGRDGIIVDSTFEDNELLEGLTIELSTVINKISSILDSNDDSIKEEIIITQKHTILIKPVSDYYFIILFMKESGNIGKARFIIRKNTLWFKEAVS